MDVSEKRPHVVTGNTPNKPRGKRIRDDNGAGSFEGVQQSPVRRTLAFQGKGSPLQKVLVILPSYSHLGEFSITVSEK